MSAMDRIWNALLCAPGEFSAIESSESQGAHSLLPASPVWVSREPGSYDFAKSLAL
jgi:hypothetical protein